MNKKKKENKNKNKKKKEKQKQNYYFVCIYRGGTRPPPLLGLFLYIHI